MWVAERLSGLLSRWFCPREAMAIRKGQPGPAPPWRPSYLFATLSDGGRELTDYHIHTLDTGLFELLHLLFHCGFKSEVRCEEARPAPGEEGTGQEVQPWAGGEKEGSESQAEPGFGSGGWHGHGGRERETPTQRKRENRRQCERGTGPPYRHPGSAPPRCCQVSPKTLWVWGGGLLRDQPPLQTRPLTEFGSSPQGLGLPLTPSPQLH